MNRFIVDYNYYNNQRFSKEVEEKIKTKEVLMNGHTGKYAAKIHNEEELELIKNYWETALASYQGTVIIENGDFRGPDWYFIYVINEYGYETVCTLETLTERKQEWENYINQFD